MTAILFTSHCPECRCRAMEHEAFCWICGAGICHSLRDCTDPTLVQVADRCREANPHLFPVHSTRSEP